MKLGEMDVEYVGDGVSASSFVPITGVRNGPESLLGGFGARATAGLFWASPELSVTIVALANTLPILTASGARTPFRGTRRGETDIPSPRCGEDGMTDLMLLDDGA
jgi:hypothetical protein